jgi:DNA polymerase-3 subunit alpha
LAEFAKYGFNKSHSAAYAVVCFQTAWLKAHHPVEFMAALMTSEQLDHDKIAELISECRATGIEVLPPDVNSSGEKFTVKDGRILFGLGAIKGLGQGPIEGIELEREKKPFEDLFDFCDRVVPRKVNRRAVEALIKSGALDTAGGADRGVMLASLERAMKDAARKHQNEDPRFRSLFAPKDGSREPVVWTEGEPFLEAERLAAEKEFLGFYVSGHPFGKFEEAARALGIRRVSEVLKSRKREEVTVCGTITEVKRKRDRNDKEFAFASVEDTTSKIELLIWSSVYQSVREVLNDKRFVVVEGLSEPQENDSRFGSAKITVDDIWPLDEGNLSRRIKSFRLTLPEAKLTERIDLLHQAPKLPPERQFPMMFMKVKGVNGDGNAFYQVNTPPLLTFSLISDCVRLLGPGCFGFSDQAEPQPNGGMGTDRKSRHRREKWQKKSYGSYRRD